MDAVLDHELSHLELVTDGYGNVKHDDLERPRLRIALHDWQFGWFDAVARRHGSDATEVQQAKKLFEDEERRQLYLAFMAEA